MKKEKISEVTTNRLSLYLRYLNEAEAAGAETVSSQAMAERLHLNSAQIRKDLGQFGELGRRGLGYSVASLREHLSHVLGLDKEHRFCVIGAGRLGSALADYYGFRQVNFSATALFDTDPDKIGKKIGDIEVLDMKSFAEVVKNDNIELAVIAVPADEARVAFEMAVEAGIRAILNFAPVSLRAPKDVRLKTVDLTTSLESLACFLAQPKRKKRKPAAERKQHSRSKVVRGTDPDV
jgi:redox-sensing transcriptional repressor